MAASGFYAALRGNPEAGPPLTFGSVICRPEEKVSLTALTDRIWITNRAGMTIRLVSTWS